MNPAARDTTPPEPGECQYRDALLVANRRRREAQARLAQLEADVVGTPNMALRAEVERLTERLRVAEGINALVRTPLENVWCWEGDGSDQPDSLTCPVVMTAAQARCFGRMAAEVAALKAGLLTVPHICGTHAHLPCGGSITPKEPKK